MADSIGMIPAVILVLIWPESNRFVIEAAP
jgi:hypothetical protein